MPQPEIDVEREHQAGKGENGEAAPGAGEVPPVGVLLVDVRAGPLAGRATPALGARGVAGQRARLGVDAFDQTDRTEEVAPRLAGEKPVAGGRRQGEGDEQAGEPPAV